MIKNTFGPIQPERAWLSQGQTGSYTGRQMFEASTSFSGYDRISGTHKGQTTDNPNIFNFVRSPCPLFTRKPFQQ